MATDGAVHSFVLKADLDAEDMIRFADGPILQLQEAAGGTPDGRMAVPQIAALARLARRLDIVIARPVLIGGDEHDIRVWVRAAPNGEGVHLAFSDWQETPHQAPRHQSALRAADIAFAAGGIEWRTDANLHFTHVGQGLDLEPGDQLFAACKVERDEGGSLISLIAARRAFFGKPVIIGKGDEAHRFLLSGHPLFDADGSFLGYRGKARASEPEETVATRVELRPDSAPGEGAAVAMPDFGRRLDRALRQPIGRIIANADTISGQVQGPLKGDYAGYAADIASAGRHLMELVDDLADLQAIDRPGFHINFEDIDLADIARRAAGLLGVKAQDRRIRVEAPAADESVPAAGEFRRSLQILVNLLSNAIRYSPEDSTVWLRASIEGDRAVVVVADQGRGIPAEDHDRVFEKFERLGRDDAAGSGLGLYISRKLARAMHGDIAIDSAPGQGARFILTLPARG